MAKVITYIVLLGTVLAVAGACAGWVASWQYGPTAFVASALAMAINWVAGSMALVVVALGVQSPLAAWRTHGPLLAIGVRMAIVVPAVIYFMARPDHPMSVAGVAGLIGVGYLMGLVFETWLSLRLVATAPAVCSRRTHATPQ